MVSVLALYSSNPSSNPACLLIFCTVLGKDENEMKKRPGLAHLIINNKSVKNVTCLKWLFVIAFDSLMASSSEAN